jgi:C4-dicarboxylate-specific signal transduction histidine kinase
MEQLMRVHVASQTVAAIAHELHQPLNAITSYSEAAIRLLDSDDARPDRLRRAVEGSMQQAHRAANVVRQLMEVVDRGAGEREPVDLNAAVHRAISMFDEADEFQLRTDLDLDPTLPAVFASRLQIEKVLANLLQNAADAMHAAGLSSASSAMAISTRSDGTMAHLTLRDSGPGLDAETAFRIFDPFFTTKRSGLGMGLPISRAIVEANGGQLWLDPQPGAGACFHFTLPFAQ